MSYEKLELLINGKWKLGSENKAEPVINPATNELIGDLPHASKKDLDEALESNAEAFKLWKKESPLNRQKIIEIALTFYFSNALIPGKFFPSKLSSIAPPPVET